MNIIYLHGFASSPSSKKGLIYRDRFAAHGIDLIIPDLNVPSFERLSLRAQLEKVNDIIASLPAGDVTLIGSSLGGCVALNYVDHYHAQPTGERVNRLILLAPAVNLIENWQRRLGDEGITDWRETGWHHTFNYAQNADAAVHYAFFEDVRQHSRNDLNVTIPTLIFHGIHDDTVPAAQSTHFAAPRPNVDLRLLESDHQLLDQVDTIWAGMREFLGL